MVLSVITNNNNNNNNNMKKVETDNNNNNSNEDEDDVRSMLQVMLQQEDAYRACDYFNELSSSASSSSSSSSKLSSSTSSSSSCSTDDVNMDCRFKMAEWCYKVVDFCHYNRDVVSIAMSYLDRFLSTKHYGQAAKSLRSEFQLAVMACLYTAVKLFEPLTIPPHTLATLSHGAYTADQMEQMERLILKALQWRMNPPTAMSFLHTFLKLIPPNMMMSASVRDTALNLATLQIELSVCEYEFVTTKASTIAMAALLNAVECMDEKLTDDLQKLLITLTTTTTTTTIIEPSNMDDVDDDDVALLLLLEETRDRLFEVIDRRPGSTASILASAAHLSYGQSELCSSVHASPRSVAIGTTTAATATTTAFLASS